MKIISTQLLLVTMFGQSLVSSSVSDHLHFRVLGAVVFVLIMVVKHLPV